MGWNVILQIDLLGKEEGLGRSCDLQIGGGRELSTEKHVCRLTQEMKKETDPVVPDCSVRCLVNRP